MFCRLFLKVRFFDSCFLFWGYDSWMCNLVCEIRCSYRLI